MAESRIDELRRRLERDPGSRLFAQLAEEHRKAGEHAEAVRVARAGLLLHPVYPSARLTLGRALLESGDAASARVELETALREAPDNILASRFLAQALEAVGDFEKALRQYNATLRMAPGDRQLEAQIQALNARHAAARARAGDGAVRSTPPAPPPRPAAPAPAPMPPPLPPVGTLPPTLRMRAPDSSAHAGAGAPGATPSPAPARSAPAVPATVEVSDDTLKPIPPGEPGTGNAFETTLPAGAAPAVVDEAPLGAPAAAAAAAEGTGGNGRGLESGSEAAGGSASLSSSTLAELYLRQGLPDRALEVYRQVLAEDPTNERARARLAELQAPAEAGPDPRSRRRQSLERTIAGLEALLGALRRR